MAAGLSDAGPAFAHALLQKRRAAGRRTVAPPADIRLTFSEGVEPKFSGVALTGAGGAVPVGRASVAPDDDKVMIVKLGQTLAPGTYTVKWHAVSVDTHHTQGTFDFTVK